jgi:4-amino-4-deoxy-L-arabinose transferase-like glycosyltransferase
MSSTMMTLGRLILAIIVGLYLMLFGTIAITSGRNFTTDSMNYVDVASNLRLGRGLLQSTLGFNTPDFAPDAPIPVPFTSQPPLYPISIGMLSLSGVSLVDAAVLVALLGYALVLLLGYLLAAQLYDEPVGLLVVAALLFYQPLTLVANHAWSETLAMSLALLSLWLLARTLQGRGRLVRGALLGGVAGGLAFDTRYSFSLLLILVLAGTVAELVASRGRKRKAEAPAIGGTYAGAFMLVAAPVLLHNWATARAVLPSYNPSTIGMLENTGSALESLFGSYAEVGDATQLEIGITVCVIVLLLVGLLRHRRMVGRWLGDTFFQSGRYLLIMWAAAYTTLLIVLRSIYHFDDLEPRLLLPAGITLVVAMAAFAARALRIGRGLGLVVAILAAIAALSLQFGALPPSSVETGAEERPLPAYLEWLAQNTTDEDLIISKDAVDIPFRLGRSGAVSYSPYPYTVRLQYSKVQELARYKCADYRHIFLAASVIGQDEQHNRVDYGEFITDLTLLRYQQYPGLVPKAQVGGTAIYEVECKPPG